MSNNHSTFLRYLPFQTLRGKLIFFACIATLPAFMFALYIATNERSAALQRAQVETLYVAENAAREHIHQLSGARQLLERLASYPSSANKPSAKMQPDWPTLLPAILSGFPQFANLGLLRTNGTLIYSVVPPPEHLDMANIPVFRTATATQNVAVGAYLMGPIIRRPTLILAKALNNSLATEQPILFAALNLEWMDQLAKSTGLPTDSVLLIIDRRGHILADSHHQNSNARPITLHGAQALLQQPTQLTRITTPDGIQRLAIAQPLEGLQGLWIVVGTPEEKVYAVANAIFIRDVVVLALLTLLAITSSLIATDFSVLKEIRVLAQATRRFGSGELQIRAPVPTAHGEIRNLALAFNAMAERLAQHSQEAGRAQERLRALSHRLQKARETEAARIAHELHDELGQELSVMRLELERLKRRALIDTSTAREGMSSLIEAFDEFGAQVDAAVRSVRRISAELRPGVLDRLGLEAGLEWLITQFERRTGIQTHFLTESNTVCHDGETATVLFRITQEALSNIARHSHASQVKTLLNIDHTTITLQIIDNGRGFDPEASSNTPLLGLLGMQERARRLHGELEVSSTLGQGVQLTIRLPHKAA